MEYEIKKTDDSLIGSSKFDYENNNYMLSLFVGFIPFIWCAIFF